MGKRPHQNMWQQLISLSKESDEGLQLQLRRSLTQLILNDRISTETALPSSRELASMLEISRSTVTLAYQRLVDEGYLISKERQGYFANAELIKLASTDQRADLNSASERFDWESRLKYRVSRQRHIHKPADWYKYPYPFIFGQVDAELMPLSEWRECLRYAQGSRNFTRGGYDLFEATRRMRLEQNERARTKQEAQRAHIQKFVDRFRYKATKARQAQSRLKALSRMQPITSPQEAALRAFTFPEPEEMSPPSYEPPCRRPTRRSRGSR